MNLKEIVNQNKLAIILVLSGLVIIGLGFLYPKIENLNLNQPKPEFKKAVLVVDLGGAVVRPGVYQVKPNEEKELRVEDVIKEAGGFSSEADLDWVTKNLNLATVLKDEMKIYIPKKGEQTTTLSSLKNSSTGVLGVTNSVNINTATEAELDFLPSVGKVTAQKIIGGRPYSSVEELKSRAIIPNSTFEKIKTSLKTQ